MAENLFNHIFHGFKQSVTFSIKETNVCPFMSFMKILILDLIKMTTVHSFNCSHQSTALDFHQTFEENVDGSLPLDVHYSPMALDGH